MPSAYRPKPCRRCGGEKGERSHSHERPWYCAPCAVEVRRERWRKNFLWWCGACDAPHYCAACSSIKHERVVAAARNRSRKRSAHPYFKPLNAELWWQQRAHSLIQAAVKRGLIPNLKSGLVACVDCGAVAHEWDHRDYGRPFDVEPVCRRCNKRRGTATWPTAERFEFPHHQPAGYPAAGEPCPGDAHERDDVGLSVLTH